MAGYLAARVRDGWRVESAIGNSAVLVRGHRPNHLLHFFITLLTCGLWILVWAGLSLTGGEQRIVVEEDQAGVHTVSAGLSPSQIVLIAAAALILLVVVGAAVTKASPKTAAVGSETASPTKAPPVRAATKKPQRPNRYASEGWRKLSEEERRALAPTLTWEEVDSLPASQMLSEEMARWSALSEKRRRR